MPLEPYKTNLGDCPKCGASGRWTKTWVQHEVCRDICGGSEHLHVRCACGYAFSTETKDARKRAAA